jgi:hypothetical protein
MENRTIVEAFIRLSRREHAHQLSPRSRRYFQKIKPNFIRKFTTDHGLYVEKYHPLIYIGFSGKPLKDTAYTYYLVHRRYHDSVHGYYFHLPSDYRHYDSIRGRLISENRFFWEEDLNPEQYILTSQSNLSDKEAIRLLLTTCHLSYEAKIYELELKYTLIGLWCKNLTEKLKNKYRRYFQKEEDLPF